MLQEAGIVGSIGSVGDALDNGLMESAIGLYKTELLGRHPILKGRAELERETAAWVHWYNNSRLSALDYLTPVEYEDRYHQQTTSSEVA
ncbi:IS3 family transposase ISMsm1 [Rhodococcus sp. T7]|uniref:Putative transposase n=1 Tax=Rhodococcus opacus (strain B4) TaxID=632772 RepID=C1BCQ8_RHOOB|nr:IS3 family transposase ISMsm1 [Rhodococcus sp. T7]KAF0965041.1 IS3 family transposase ISMsm1 [Rhodococcus sp. T7]BAH55652.1 putative transposase [Rhodococcus opacus B4]